MPGRAPLETIVPPASYHGIPLLCGGVFLILDLVLLGSAIRRGLSFGDCAIVAAGGLIPAILFVVAGLVLRSRYKRRLRARDAFWRAIDRNG